MKNKDEMSSLSLWKINKWFINTFVSCLALTLNGKFTLKLLLFFFFFFFFTNMRLHALKNLSFICTVISLCHSSYCTHFHMDNYTSWMSITPSFKETDVICVQKLTCLLCYKGSRNRWEMFDWNPGFKNQWADSWSGGSIQRWWAIFFFFLHKSTRNPIFFLTEEKPDHVFVFTAYGRDIEESIIADTSGHFKKMLVVLLQVSEIFMLIYDNIANLQSNV